MHRVRDSSRLRQRPWQARSAPSNWVLRSGSRRSTRSRRLCRRERVVCRRMGSVRLRFGSVSGSRRSRCSLLRAVIVGDRRSAGHDRNTVARVVMTRREKSLLKLGLRMLKTMQGRVEEVANICGLTGQNSMSTLKRMDLHLDVFTSR